jgi:hypothetical protein
MSGVKTSCGDCECGSARETRLEGDADGYSPSQPTSSGLELGPRWSTLTADGRRWLSDDGPPARSSLSLRIEPRRSSPIAVSELRRLERPIAGRATADDGFEYGRCMSGSEVRHELSETVEGAVSVAGAGVFLGTRTRGERTT